MSKPTVLLLNPGALGDDRDFGLPHLVALGSYLERELPVRAAILDLGYEDGTLASLWPRVEELGPLLLAGISAYSSFDHPRVLALARALRQRLPGVPLVAGGYHASALPGELAGEGRAFDHAVVGEGERPLAALAAALLGGTRPEAPVLGPDPVPELDALPPYDWSLLGRYLPRAAELGGKVQLYLSRGCPFRCTFCMERCKGERRWRAFSPERALDELRRLHRALPLRRFVLNVADPLFGLRPDWRRAVLEGIAREGLLPRQHWTLTRVDALEPEDVELLVRARFAVGVGLESGSPRMLEVMRKAEHPARYLDGIRHFAGLARRAGLTWAANLILGHPGEDAASLGETAAFVRELFPAGQETPGWLSVDPFRLYPGSEVFEAQAAYAERFGARFHAPRWWEGGGDRSLAAELVDPSATLRAEERAAFAGRELGPLVGEIRVRFRFTGRSVDAVYRHSLDEQVELLAPAQVAEQLAAMARLLAGDSQPLEPGDGLADEVVASARARLPEPLRAAPGLDEQARLLAALAPRVGELVVVVGARSAAGLALAAELVGPRGRVHARASTRAVAVELRRQLAGLPALEVRVYRSARRLPRSTALLVDGCLPYPPRVLCERLLEGGRLLAAVGPRYRGQRLLLVWRRRGEVTSRDLGEIRLPPLAGEEGWLR